MMRRNAGPASGGNAWQAIGRQAVQAMVAGELQAVTLQGTGRTQCRGQGWRRRAGGRRASWRQGARTNAGGVTMGRCVGRARHHAAGGEDGAERMRATMVHGAGGPYAGGPARRALCAQCQAEKLTGWRPCNPGPVWCDHASRKSMGTTQCRPVRMVKESQQ
jgi:hypothetical protein